MRRSSSLWACQGERDQYDYLDVDRVESISLFRSKLRAGEVNLATGISNYAAVDVEAVGVCDREREGREGSAGTIGC